MKQDIFDAQIGDDMAVQLSVSQWNLHAAAARRETKGHGVLNTSEGATIGAPARPPVGVLAYNSTGSAIKPGDVVAFDGPVYDPDPDGYNNATGSFFRQTALKLKAPDADTGDRFGIVLDVIPASSYGRVVVSGDVRCKIHLEAAGDRNTLRAAVDPDDSTRLKVSDGGRALVLWVDELANYPGDAWAIVCLDAGGSSKSYHGLIGSAMNDHGDLMPMDPSPSDPLDVQTIYEFASKAAHSGDIGVDLYGWTPGWVSNSSTDYIPDFSTDVTTSSGTLGNDPATAGRFVAPYLPLKPGSVHIYLEDGTIEITDNGTGGLSDGGTIDYDTGAFVCLTPNTFGIAYSMYEFQDQPATWNCFVINRSGDYSLSAETLVGFDGQTSEEDPTLPLHWSCQFWVRRDGVDTPLSESYWGHEHLDRPEVQGWPAVTLKTTGADLDRSATDTRPAEPVMSCMAVITPNAYALQAGDKVFLVFDCPNSAPYLKQAGGKRTSWYFAKGQMSIARYD